MSSIQSFKDDLANLIELGNDPTYANEIAPAYAFFYYAPEYLRLNFVNIQKNKKDPPDFFLELKEGNLINLEVTSLANELIFKTNKFIENLERAIMPLIEKYKNLLPAGAYIIIVFPGKEKLNYLHMDVDDFKSTISEIELKKNLEGNIPKWFKEYERSDKTDYPICNDTGDRIGELTISKLCDAKDTKISVWPQGVHKYKNWSLKELEDKLQERIYEKEDKYINKYDGIWWLLVSDRENLMNTIDLDFDISEIAMRAKFFKKVFLIRYENKVDELKVRFS